MRNRAKCKLCNEILESFHEFDYVTCKCEEIAITGGNVKYQASAKDWKNFIRIDDMNKEILITVIDDDRCEDICKEVTDVNPLYIEPLNNKKQLVDGIQAMIDSYKNLPETALYQPITHQDFLSLLLVLDEFLRLD